MDLMLADRGEGGARPGADALHGCLISPRPPHVLFTRQSVPPLHPSGVLTLAATLNRKMLKVKVESTYIRVISGLEMCAFFTAAGANCL